jgi:methionyl-tRNA formyltransferase
MSELPVVVYFGTPDFAVPALEELINRGECKVAAIVTQPDKPSGRGQKLTAPPVKVIATKHNIPVFQPESLKSISLHTEKTTPNGRPELTATKSALPLVEFLNELPRLDVMIAVAYGKLLPAPLVNYIPLGFLNIHPSLLPKWRGAAPLQRALFAGDKETGVAIMQIDEGLDSGPVFMTERLPIAEDETLGTLHDSCARIGAKLLADSVPKIVSGELSARAQSDATGLPYAEKWEKSDCIIKWEQPADVTLRRVRTCNPIPGARTELDGSAVKIYTCKKASSSLLRLPVKPGEVIMANKEELIVATGPCDDSGNATNCISILEMQLPGKKKLPVAEVLKGHSISPGQCFS